MAEVGHGATRPTEGCQDEQIYANPIKVNQTLGKAGECLDAATVDDDFHAEHPDDAAVDREMRGPSSAQAMRLAQMDEAEAQYYDAIDELSASTAPTIIQPQEGQREQSKEDSASTWI